MISTGINLVMTVIGFSVSTMFIVFVCTRLICARIHLNASRRSFPLASRSDLSIMERGLHGLEPVVVSNFPTKKYSDEFFSTVDDSQCTVCLADYHNEDVLRILPYCGHAFHAACIDIWLRQHSTCPVCRISLREVSEKKRSMQPLFGSALRPHRSLPAFNQHPRPCGIPGHSPNCMLPGHAYSSRTTGGTRMNSIREDCFVAENDEAQTGERTPIIDEGNRPSGSDKGHKTLESPSTA